MSFKFFNISKKDLLAINKILINEIGKNELKDIKQSFKTGFAKKIEIDKKMIGFCLATEFTTHISLSYYYLDEDYRKKPVSLFFFAFCFSHLLHKPIYVKKNKNYDLYKRYFESTEEDEIIKFTNLRKDYEWAELLKQFQM